LGYGPYDLQSAYGLLCLSASGGIGKVVAVVESGHAPTLENDLAVYRHQYGLPACTQANGCLQVVGQDGGTTLPPYDPNWGGETQVDVDAVSAICPNCHILVVEASDEDMGLLISVNTAVRLGAFAVSNSWGNPPEDPTKASFFQHPGVAIVVASGDSGYEDGIGSVEMPSDFSSVISIGATSLLRAPGARGWAESAWDGSGSGCSKVIPKPSWQTDTACSMRTLNDIAFDGDPMTGIAIYDSNPNDGPTGWQVAGGTSVSAPAVAAIYALAGARVDNASSLYAAAGGSALNDVTRGSNGHCSPALLCTAGAGYDGPTGNGTPNGGGAFSL
jgi:subtilase family serine protease